MRIVVLADNRTLNDDLVSEHGLCIFVETENYTCLLDLGASDIFIHNALKLGIDIKEVDYVFISHGHLDHIGGLPSFLELNKKAKIVMSKNAMKQSYFSKRNGFRKISLDIDLLTYNDRFVYVESEMVIKNEIHVFTSKTNNHAFPKANGTLFKEDGNGLVLDDFNHEFIVSFGTDSLFVYTGCAHKGLLNIMDSISLFPSKKIDFVMGGFHLLDSKPDQEFESSNEIDSIAQELKANYPETTFITGHCTGEKVYDRLHETLKNQIVHFYTGYSINIQ